MSATVAGNDMHEFRRLSPGDLVPSAALQALIPSHHTLGFPLRASGLYR